MSNTTMYPNLNNIGLENYLTACCGGQIHEDPWLRRLDLFIKDLPKKNIDILKLKINNNLEPSQITDLLNEIMVACAFHPQADFIREDNDKIPDLYDKSTQTYIEVKSLNEGDDEKERHKQDKFFDISGVLSGTEKAKRGNKILNNIYKKTCDHLSKATCQLNNKGRIYLVYDYNFLFRDNVGTKNNPSYTNPQIYIVSKKDVSDQIKKAIGDFRLVHPYVVVEAIYFGDLREQVANSRA